MATTNNDYEEPLHPRTGKPLTDLDRTLLQLHFVSVELSILLRGVHHPVIPPPAPPAEISLHLRFSIATQAMLLTWKFIAVLETMKRDVSRLPKMIEARRAIAPLVDRIELWPGLDAYRNTALAHPYLTKDGKFINPTWLINAGAAPANIAESLLLASCAYYAIGGICSAFQSEYVALSPLYHLKKARLPDRGVSRGEEIMPQLMSLVDGCADALRKAGLPTGIFDLFLQRFMDDDDQAEEYFRAATEIVHMEREVALHEAGHAVVAWAMGWNVGEMSVELAKERDGYTAVESVPPHNDLRAWTRFLRAGGVAISIDRGASDNGKRFGNASDNERLDELFKLGKASDAECAAHRIAGDTEARTILTKHWSTAQALAAALMEADKLDPIAVRSILGSHDHASCWT